MSFRNRQRLCPESSLFNNHHNDARVVSSTGETSICIFTEMLPQHTEVDVTGRPAAVDKYNLARHVGEITDTIATAERPISSGSATRFMGTRNCSDGNTSGVKNVLLISVLVNPGAIALT